MPHHLPERLRRYWRANERLIAVLLIVWASVSLLGSILFVDALNMATILGLPLGFFLAQQGAIYVFVLIVFAYALTMDRMDHKYHADED